MDQKKDNEKDKKSLRKRIVLFVAILLAIHIILVLIKIPTTITGKVTLQVLNISEDIEPKNTNKQVCERGPYRWDYTWEGYADSNEDYTSPRYRLQNYEEKGGNFYIQFLFFDEAEHNFVDFQNLDYENVSHRLEKDIKMRSENLSVYLSARESRVVVASVKKADPVRTYWTYAIVTAPIINRCINVDVNQDILVKNSTYINITKDSNSTIYISLWDLLVRRN